MSERVELPPPPLCVWCGAPWTDDMLKVAATANMDYGYYPEDVWVESFDAVIDVHCGSCKRLVYRKELRNLPCDRY